ncbi:OPT oligopeptide transporter protein-domain-containing protein [Chytridium lagenaria]|nr:OPT oligopeptide transporter protein-domain-containing protein [Chytridium lagenaria]
MKGRTQNSSHRRNHVNAFVAASEEKHDGFDRHDNKRNTFFFDVDSGKLPSQRFHPRNELEERIYYKNTNKHRFSTSTTGDESATDNSDTAVETDNLTVWVIGIFFSVILAFVTLFTFRTNFFSSTPSLQSSPPTHWLLHGMDPPTGHFKIPFTSLSFQLNPGPFSFKEHTLIYVFTVTAARPAYCLYNIVVQRYILGQNISVAWCMAFAIASQCFGYGLAGLTRKFLVRPASMLWPSNLGTIALLRSLHRFGGLGDEEEEEDKMKNGKSFMSRSKFFGCAFSLWRFISGSRVSSPLPLGAISLLCHVAPNNQRIKMLGSAKQGLGLLSFSFDWTFITVFSPIVTPLWAFMNQFIGIWITCWLIIPILWSKNAFGNDQQIGSDPFDGANGTGQFPLGQALNTPSLFDKNGRAISALNILTITNHTVTLDEEAYALVAPIRLSTYFAVEYASYFVMFAAVLVHVWLWYGKDLWYRFRTSVRDLDADDIHAKMMDVYPEVSDAWYIFLLVVTFLLAIAVGQWGGFDLPWWSVLLSLAVSGICMIPIVGHYAKYGYDGVINVAVAVGVFEVIGVERMMNDPPMGWSPIAYQIFLSAGTIWGGIGPPVFRPQLPLSHLHLWLHPRTSRPLFFYALHKYHPTGLGISSTSPFSPSSQCSRHDPLRPNHPLMVAFIVNLIVRKFHAKWWQRYAYIMSAGFDTGAAISLTVILLLVGINPEYNVIMPFYGLNRMDQESCAPEVFLTCTEQMIWGSAYGRKFNFSDVLPQCEGFGADAMRMPSK